MVNISFSEKDIYSVLEKASPQEIDACDFGVVKMDREGIIKAYNKYEAELASIPQQEAIGKNFFIQIAPCTNNFLVSAKYLEHRRQRDEVLEYVFTYRISPTPVMLRLLINPEVENQYLLVKKITE